MRELYVGQNIVYIDSVRRRVPALVQAVHGEMKLGSNGIWYIPCINLIHVSLDAAKTDRYGRQIEHKTSVSHWSNQTPCVGNCFAFVDDVVQIDEHNVQTQR